MIKRVNKDFGDSPGTRLSLKNLEIPIWKDGNLKKALSDLIPIFTREKLDLKRMIPKKVQEATLNVLICVEGDSIENIEFKILRSGKI